jgi:hypothetical protein
MIHSRSLRAQIKSAHDALRRLQTFNPILLLPRAGMVAAAAAGVLGASFVLTWWITAPDVFAACSAGGLRSDAQRMAACPVASYSDLAKLAQDMGLRHSLRLKGAIDAMDRIDERTVRMGGWLADVQGDGTPLDVLVFSRGKVVGWALTKGARDDVARAANLSGEAAQNVVVSLDFACERSDAPVVVGVGRGRDYLALPVQRCP